MSYHSSKLKRSLEEIRNSIDLEKKDWINIDDTNCYAYALGLDIPGYEIVDYAYIPGVIADSDISLRSHKIFSYEDLLYNMYLDFIKLGIDFREIKPLDEVSVDEWKIALFITKSYYSADGLEDFHFLRQHNDGFWYHKDGYHGAVSRLDSYNRAIENPEECFLIGRTYKKCLSLRINKG